MSNSHSRPVYPRVGQTLPGSKDPAVRTRSVAGALTIWAVWRLDALLRCGWHALWLRSRQRQTERRPDHAEVRASRRRTALQRFRPQSLHLPVKPVLGRPPGGDHSDGALANIELVLDPDQGVTLTGNL